MPAASDARVRTWDLWVRLTHWTIAGIVVWNLFGPTDQLHRVLGYVAAGLVGLRVVWGFVGTRYARFSAWWPTPSHLAEYLRSLAAGKPLPVTLTTPPAGAWEITIGQGGLPIIKDGKVIAAMGCGGSLPANDEKFCQAGISAMGK